MSLKIEVTQATAELKIRGTTLCGRRKGGERVFEVYNPRKPYRYRETLHVVTKEQASEIIEILQAALPFLLEEE